MNRIMNTFVTVIVLWAICFFCPPLEAGELANAALYGDYAKVRQLLAQGADVNEGRGVQRTPLHQAVFSGFKDMVNILIGKGGDVNSRDGNGDTPLMTALLTGRPEMMRLLIQKGANVNARNKRQETALHQAVASFIKNTEDILLLLQNGADVNARDGSQRTPLHILAEKNEIEAFPADAAFLLIKNGADVNARDKNGQTPAMVAEKKNNPTLVAMLGKTGSALQDAYVSAKAARDSEDAAKRELAANIEARSFPDVNARDKFRKTPLHLAAEKGNTELAAVLIRRGADVNARDNLQQTPLHVAALLGKAGVAALLIEKGADLNARAGFDQETPLHVAACQESIGQKETVMVLVQKGADVNARNKEQLTPALAAERCKHPEIAAIIRNTGGSAGSAGGDLDPLLQKIAKSGGQWYFKFEDDLRDIVRLARAVNPPPAVPQAARDEMTKGKAAFKLSRRPEDFGAAVENFKKAASLAPWLAEPYFNLALAQEKFAAADGRQQNLFEAKRSLEYYLIAAPDAKDAPAVKQKMAELDVTMKRFSDFIDKVDMGAGAYSRGSYSEAIRYWKWALEIYPDHPEIVKVYRNIGNASIDRKDWDEALKYMQKALEISPSDAGGNNSMGYLLQMRGDRPKACMYYKKACDLGNAQGCKNVSGQCP